MPNVHSLREGRFILVQFQKAQAMFDKLRHRSCTVELSRQKKAAHVMVARKKWREM